MAYATLDDVKQRLGTSIYTQLTDRVNGAVADDDVGQELLDGSHGVLNARIKSSPRRYRVPVDVSSDTTLAAFLKDAVLDVVEYQAWQGWPGRKRVPERVENGYRETIAYFDRIAKGDAELPGEVDVQADTSSITGNAFGYEQRFNESDMGDF